MDFSVEVSEIDGDIVIFRFSQGDLGLDVLAHVVLDDQRCLFRGVHIQGSGANTIGAARLMRLARQVKEELGVEELRIEGATRTSGSSPGRRPRPLVFR